MTSSVMQASEVVDTTSATDLIQALKTGEVSDIATAAKAAAGNQIANIRDEKGEHVIGILADRVKATTYVSDQDILQRVLFFAKAVAALVIEGGLDLADERLKQRGGKVSDLGAQLKFWQRHCPVTNYLGSYFSELCTAIERAKTQKDEPDLTAAKMAKKIIGGRCSL